MWKYKVPRMAEMILKWRNKVGRYLPDFQTYCKARVMRTAYWQKDIHAEISETE